jgi:hypothetical protein
MAALLDLRILDGSQTTLLHLTVNHRIPRSKKSTNIDLWPYLYLISNSLIPPRLVMTASWQRYSFCAITECANLELRNSELNSQV